MSDPMLRQLLEEVLVAAAEIRVLRKAIATDESLIAVDEHLEAHRQTVKAWIDRTFTEKRAVLVIPERCAAVDEEICGRKNPESVSRRPGWEPMCKGCGLDPDYE
jgi:hypothetical protein